MTRDPEVARPDRADERPGPRAALRVAPYRRWFAAQIFSASGANTQVVAMAWIIVSRTHDGVALALLSFLIFVPVLFAGPWAGRVVDRFARHRILLATQLAYFVLGAILVVAAVGGFDGIPFLYAVALATGIVTAVDAPARQIYVQDLLPRRLIPAAIGLFEVVMNLARVLGPGVAGILLALGGAVPAFVFNAVAYLPAIWAVVRNRDVPSFAEPAAPGDGRVSVWAGLGWAVRHPDVLVVLLLAMASGLLFNLTVSVPLLADGEFAIGPQGYGMLIAVFGCGALLGAVRAATQHTAPPFGRTLQLAAVTGVLVLASAVAPVWQTFAVGLLLVGGVSIWFVARANAYVQLAAPAGIRGQVMSIWTMSLMGVSPFLGLLAGWTAQVAGPRAAFSLSGWLFVAVIAAAAATRLVRRRPLERGDR